MKCQFCGTNSETVIERQNGLTLCEKCNEARLERESEAMEEQKVINIREDMPAMETAPEEEKKSDIKAEAVIGMKLDGSLYFNVRGEGVDLVVIEGLLEFGKRRMKQIWDQRDYELQKAAYEAQQKAAAEEAGK